MERQELGDSEMGLIDVCADPTHFDLTGRRGTRKREAEAEIANIDSQKLMMKKACARTFGVRIGRLARQVPRWKEALSSAQQPQRPDGRGWRRG
jgi:hypothetical protein